MTTTRHGNNIHPELPPCPFCGHWAWRTCDTHMGLFCQVFYECETAECRGTATALTCGLAMASIFERPALLGTYRVVGSDWINAVLKTLRRADLNGCIYAKDEPPAQMLVEVPVPAGATFLYAGDAWQVALPTEIVDLSALFRKRVELGRAMEMRGQQPGPLEMKL